MRTLFVAAFVSQVLTFNGVHGDVPVGTAEIATDVFCDIVRGSYKIESVNGVKPKPEAETAMVEKDTSTSECILTFPYCIPDSSCDPGYLFLGFSTAKVYKSLASTNGVSFTILTQFDGKDQHYILGFDNGNLKFTNFQYIMPSGKIVTLEYLGKKNSGD